MKSMSDLMFNLVIIFCLLFFLSFLQININKQKKQGVRPPAEILVMVEWPDGMASDVDSWMLMPNNDIVWFRDQDKNICVLDRDDLGNGNNAIRLPDGTIIRDETNKEVITIRTKAAGKYIVNVHLYNRKNNEKRIPVTITVMQVNPMVTDLYKATVFLTKQWQEISVCEITVTKWGSKWAEKAKRHTPLVSRRLKRTGAGGGR